MKKFKVTCDLKVSLDNLFINASDKEAAIKQLKKQDIINIISLGFIKDSDVIIHEVEEVEEDDRSELPWDYSKHFD